ncbi:MAG: heme exporter protein CcmD [Rhodospirillaceae bacterium]|nr:heme exporter protein CcmD [Rhodospirillaceae bacterium]
MGEFLEMGGYAAFVWPAYGLSFGLLALLAWLSLKGLKDTQKMFDRLSADAEIDERKSDK